MSIIISTFSMAFWRILNFVAQATLVRFCEGCSWDCKFHLLWFRLWLYLKMNCIPIRVKISQLTILESAFPSSETVCTQLFIYFWAAVRKQWESQGQVCDVISVKWKYEVFQWPCLMVPYRGLDFGIFWSGITLYKNLNMKNIGTKSVNMFSSTIDKILCFWISTAGWTACVTASGALAVSHIRHVYAAVGIMQFGTEAE